MKKIFIILSISGILLQTFSNSFILINYQVNKEYITKNLCENKNKPMMHCNGKCHLQKQLAEQEKKDKSPFSQNIKNKFENQYFSEDIIANIIPVNETAKGNSRYCFSVSITTLQSVFHPPSIV